MHALREQEVAPAVRPRRGPGTGYKTGEQHHRARLSARQVREMRAAYEGGEGGYATLGRRFGCPWPTVRDIVKYWTRARE